jgi:uncharacterized membrane protein
MGRTFGFILIILGVLMFIWTGFSYTRREKIVDAGPVHISADKEHSVNWPPYAGVILVIGGIVLVAISRRSD